MSNNVYANQADELEMERLRRAGHCTECGLHMDECECEPKLSCHGCGAELRSECDCARLGE